MNIVNNGGQSVYTRLSETVNGMEGCPFPTGLRARHDEHTIGQPRQNKGVTDQTERRSIHNHPVKVFASPGQEVRDPPASHQFSGAGPLYRAAAMTDRLGHSVA